MTQKEKKELSDEEKEYKSKRKMIQEKLIKFATRVPVFMYLTDYREYSLKDVITQLEPELFKKVTGLNVKDFELLVSLNVFNESLMNDAVYKFKRYEDSSLSYTGIDRHAGERIGLYSTVLTRQDYDEMAGQLITSMEAAPQSADDVPDSSYFAATDEPPKSEEALPSKIKESHENTAVNEAATAAPKTNLDAKAPFKPKPFQPKPMTFVGRTAIKEDFSDIAVGSSVAHKAFGKGTVLSIDGGFIVVSFDGLEKKFNYPGAFQQNFLRRA